MAKSEVLVRMKADTSGYDANIAKARRQLDQFKKDNLSAGGVVKQLSSSLVSSAAKFASFGAAASAAAKLAKDAFFQLESNIDEWGRSVKAAEGAYDIFLQTLNNGNWSNFFSNLSQAITGARDLYDALDRLGSIKANNAVAIAMTQSEIQNLRLLKQQGQNVDDKIKEATARLKALQSQSASAGINAGRGSVVNTLRNGVNSIGGASINDATLKRVADNIANQGQAYFDFMKRRADYLEQKGMVTRTETIYDSQGGTYERQYRKFDINALSREQQKQYAIAKTVTERETEIQKGLTVWSQAVNEQASSTREIFRDNRYAMQGSGGGKTGGGNKAVDINALVAGQWEKTMLRGANAGVKAEELSGGSEAFKAYAESVKQESAKAEDSINRLTKAFESLNEAQGVTATEEVTKNVNATAIAARTAANAISSIGQAFSSIEDPAARVAGLVAQAIATVAVAYAEALETDWTSKTSIWSFISAAAASTASMIATIASIHQATGYAQGGEIKGNSYSGDNIPIMANAGEVVLTKAMTRTLAANLQGNGFGNLNLMAKVKGTELLVWLDNSLEQSGRGELVTWGR